MEATNGTGATKEYISEDDSVGAGTRITRQTGRLMHAAVTASRKRDFTLVAAVKCSGDPACTGTEDKLGSQLHLHGSSSTCPICPQLIFSKKSNLYRHLRSYHSEIAMPLKRHRQKQLDYKQSSSERNPSCSICGRSFSRISHLKRHVRLLHTTVSGTESADFNSLRQRKTGGVSTKRIETIRMKCPVCRIALSAPCGKRKSDMSDLLQHINTSHSQSISYQEHNFESEADFKHWFSQIQLDNTCAFVRSSCRLSKSKRTIYYSCSRSGIARPYRLDKRVSSNTPSGLRKRRLKQQGVSKVGFTCPAHMVCVIMGSRHHVRYVPDHFCYSDRFEQLRHLRISAEDRRWFADQLELNIPVETIIKEARSNLDGELQRRHIVTRSDLRNIARDFGLTKRHQTPSDHIRPTSDTSVDDDSTGVNDDSIGVAALIRTDEISTNSPVIFYKCVGEDLMLAEIPQDSLSKQQETDARIACFSHKTPGSECLRDTARKLSSDIAHLIETVRDDDLVVSIIQSLCAVRPKMEAVVASRSSVALVSK